MQSNAGGSRLDRESQVQDVAAQRDPRASRTDIPNTPGYYAQQPDGPVVRGNAEKRGRIRRRSPDEEDEQGRAKRRHGPGRQGPLDGPDPYLCDENENPLHDEEENPLCLDRSYEEQTGNLDGWRNRAPAGLKPREYRYRVKERVKWDPSDALFLYREVQKVPIELPGDFVHMVLLRFQTSRLRPFNLAQCRDKMRQVVATRVNNGRAIIGNARKYLRDPDVLKDAFDAEREAALEEHRQKIRNELAADDDMQTEGGNETHMDGETQTDGESSYRPTRRGRPGVNKGKSKGKGRARPAGGRNASSSLAQPPVQAESEVDEALEQDAHAAREGSQPAEQPSLDPMAEYMSLNGNGVGDGQAYHDAMEESLQTGTQSVVI